MIEKIIQGNNIEVLKTFPDNYFDSVITDPPYGINFMGKKWDYDVPNVDTWKEVLRVLKPGGHMLVACGTRTQHRMAVNIEDAGFEIRDIVAWVYGSGFPKSMDISKAIDKNKALSKVKTKEFGGYIKKRRIELKLTQKEVDDYVCGGSTNYSFFEGRKNQQRMPSENEYLKIKEILKLDDEWDEFIGEAEREKIGEYESTKNSGGMPLQGTREKTSIDITKPSTDLAKKYEGWGTALKPSMELWTLARKPLIGTVAENVIEYGVGGINIDASRVPASESDKYDIRHYTNEDCFVNDKPKKSQFQIKEKNILGRFPANFIHDGSEEVENLFPKEAGGGNSTYNFEKTNQQNTVNIITNIKSGHHFGDSGSASRFFYVPKASQSERNYGLSFMESKTITDGRKKPIDNAFNRGETERKNIHPTVKPIELMRYLIKMITPKNGIVLDLYAGSGSTLIAAKMDKFQYVGIEREKEYIDIINARIKAYVVEYDIFDFL